MRRPPLSDGIRTWWNRRASPACRAGFAIGLLGWLSVSLASSVRADNPQFPGAASDPAAVAQGSRTDLFVRGTDGAIWHTWRDDSYHSWESLGGDWQGSPAADTLGPGHVGVVARSRDNAIWDNDFLKDRWSGWRSIGGTLTSDPGAVAVGRDSVHIFARGTDNAIWHRWWERPCDCWRNWESLGGTATSGPAAESLGSGHVEVFVRGTDNAIWHRFFFRGWRGWWTLGGNATAGPGAVATGPNRIDLFMRSSDNNTTFRKQWNRDADWGVKWDDFGGCIGGRPYPAADGWVYATGCDGHIYFRTFLSTGDWRGWPGT